MTGIPQILSDEDDKTGLLLDADDNGAATARAPSIVGRDVVRAAAATAEAINPALKEIESAEEA